MSPYPPPVWAAMWLVVTLFVALALGAFLPGAEWGGW